MFFFSRNARNTEGNDASQNSNGSYNNNNANLLDIIRTHNTAGEPIRVVTLDPSAIQTVPSPYERYMYSETTRSDTTDNNNIRSTNLTTTTHEGEDENRREEDIQQSRKKFKRRNSRRKFEKRRSKKDRINDIPIWVDDDAVRIEDQELYCSQNEQQEPQDEQDGLVKDDKEKEENGTGALDKSDISGRISSSTSAGNIPLSDKSGEELICRTARSSSRSISEEEMVMDIANKERDISTVEKKNSTANPPTSRTESSNNDYSIENRNKNQSYTIDIDNENFNEENTKSSDACNHVKDQSICQNRLPGNQDDLNSKHAKSMPFENDNMKKERDNESSNTSSIVDQQVFPNSRTSFDSNKVSENNSNKKNGSDPRYRKELPNKSEEENLKINPDLPLTICTLNSTDDSVPSLPEVKATAIRIDVENRKDDAEEHGIRLAWAVPTATATVPDGPSPLSQENTNFSSSLPFSFGNFLQRFYLPCTIPQASPLESDDRRNEFYALFKLSERLQRMIILEGVLLLLWVFVFTLLIPLPLFLTPVFGFQGAKHYHVTLLVCYILLDMIMISSQLYTLITNFAELLPTIRGCIIFNLLFIVINIILAAIMISKVRKINGLQIQFLRSQRRLFRR